MSFLADIEYVSICGSNPPKESRKSTYIKLVVPLLGRNVIPSFAELLDKKS